MQETKAVTSDFVLCRPNSSLRPPVTAYERIRLHENSKQCGWRRNNRTGGLSYHYRSLGISLIPSGSLGSQPSNLISYPTARPVDRQGLLPSLEPSRQTSWPITHPSSPPSLSAAPQAAPASNFSFTANPTLSTWYVPWPTGKPTQGYTWPDSSALGNYKYYGHGTRSQIGGREHCDRQCGIAIGTIFSITALAIVAFFTYWYALRRKKAALPKERFTRLEGDVAADRYRCTKNANDKRIRSEKNSVGTRAYCAWWEAPKKIRYHDRNAERLRNVLSLQHSRATTVSIHDNERDIENWPEITKEACSPNENQEDYCTGALSFRACDSRMTSYASTIRQKDEYHARSSDGGTSTWSDTSSTRDCHQPILP